MLREDGPNDLAEGRDGVVLERVLGLATARSVDAIASRSVNQLIVDNSVAVLGYGMEEGEVGIVDFFH